MGCFPLFFCDRISSYGFAFDGDRRDLSERSQVRRYLLFEIYLRL